MWNSSKLSIISKTGLDTASRSTRILITASFRTLFLLLILLAGSHTVYAQETIGVYVSPPGELQFNLSTPPYNPTTEDFEGFGSLPNTTWATPDFTTGLGTYVQTTGDSQVQIDDDYGTGMGDYMSIGTGGVVTLDLDEPVRYFGFAWPAGDDGNEIEVFRNGVSLFTLQTADIVNFLPNDGTVRTALDGSSHATADYYGKPTGGANIGEPYAYIHIVASEGLLYDQVVFRHTDASGRFETDNHTVLFTGDQPDTDGGGLDWIEVYEQIGPTANDDQSLNNTPGDPVVIDVVSNDTAGDFPIDPTSVVITGSLPSGSTLSPDGKTLTVPGEGVWTVNATTGAITFTPEGGFLGDPTPIEYRFSDNDGIASNIATVTVTYSTAVDAVNDSAGPVDGINGTDDVLNVLDNDLLDGVVLNPADVTLTENSSDPELTLNSDGSIDVEPGTPDGSYTVDYEICENASPSNCDTATATVTVLSTISTQLTDGSCWRMLSSPVDGGTYNGILGNLWTQGMPGSDYPESNDPNVFVWDNTVSGTGSNGWDPPASLENSIPAGTGFLISVFTDDEYGTPGGWPKTITASAAEHAAPVTVNSSSMNENGDGWTLLGNPYKAPIDFSQLTTTDITDVAYIYDRSIGSWVSTTSDSYGDVTDGVISPFQGFFVQNVSSITNPSVVFPESSRATGGEFYGKEKTRKDFIRFEVKGSSLYNSMWIRFSDDGSINKVTKDALKLSPLAEEYALIASRKEDGTLVDIGHYPYPSDELQIPVHLEVTKGGTYTITATDLDLPAGAKLYFTDQQTDQSIRIDDRFEYTFTISQAEKINPDGGLNLCSNSPHKAKTNDWDRFMITSSAWETGVDTEIPTQTTLEQNFPNPFNPSTVIRFNLAKTSEVQLEVFDMLGRRISTLVQETLPAGAHSVNFNASELNSGIYFYRLSTQNQVYSKQMILIK